MKVILSRKGFDSQYGRIPSPIMPDGVMLSLPIPAKDGNAKYDALMYKSKSYSEIIHELSPATYEYLEKDFNLKCHLDPDIRQDAMTRPTNWTPVFGQCAAAESHLRNMGVGTGDVFLFFGTFRKTEYCSSGIIKYRNDEPELHVIFGYMQVGKRITDQKIIKEIYPWHPHANNDYPQNAIYLPADTLSFIPNKPGSGTLIYSPELILTETERYYSKSRWSLLALPDFLHDISISYHNSNAFKDGYFQSAGRGQEFVIEYHKDLEKWCSSKIAV